MKYFLLFMLCCPVGLVLAGEPSSLRFQRVVIYDNWHNTI